MEKYYQVYYDLLSSLTGQMETVMDALPQEALDWSPGVDMNSVAVLAAHTSGATRFLIAEMAAEKPSRRSRQSEFATSDVSGESLNNHLRETLAHCKDVLEDFELADLHAVRIHPVDGKDYTVAWCLGHALEHFAQHLGNMEVTRQLWEMQNV